MTREEAIKILKDMPRTPDQERALMAIVGAEWVESEDEMIRTALCDIVRDMPYMETELRARGLTVKKTIAYLEKQKEQKPAWEDGSFNEDKFLSNELSAFLQNYDKEYDDDAAVSDVARHFYEIGKKQKEQMEVDLEKLGEIARHIIAVKQNVEDMRLSEEEWSLLEKIGYPQLNARKEK